MKGPLKAGVAAIFVLSACAPLEDNDPTTTGRQSISDDSGESSEQAGMEAPGMETGGSPEDCQPLIDALATAPPEAHDELIQAFDECMGAPAQPPTVDACEFLLHDAAMAPPEIALDLLDAYEVCVAGPEGPTPPDACEGILEMLPMAPPEFHEGIIADHEACMGQGHGEAPPNECEAILESLPMAPPELHEGLILEYELCVGAGEEPPAEPCEGLLEMLPMAPPEFHEDLILEYEACMGAGHAPAEPTLECNEGYGGDAYTAQGSGLHVIGIYEAHSNHGFQYHPEGHVTVRVEASMQPITLVLSSYEPVHWQLDVAPGALLERVIINGYHDANISGQGPALVEEFTQEGTGAYIEGVSVFDFEDTQTQAFLSAMELYTGQTLSSFQGCYNEDAFTVAGGATP